MTRSVRGPLPFSRRLISLVKVFSKPNCPQCDMTYKVLKAEGIEFDKIDITKDDSARSFIMDDLGYLQAPVVVSGDKHWSGFRPDLIKTIKAA